MSAVCWHLAGQAVPATHTQPCLPPSPFPPLPFPARCRETADNWDAEIAEDVGGECQKYGAVLHVFVDRNSRGFVYVVGGWGCGLRTPVGRVVVPAAFRHVASEAQPLSRDSKLLVPAQKFADVAAAANAQRALHGRWFAARQIAADFQVGGWRLRKGPALCSTSSSGCGLVQTVCTITARAFLWNPACACLSPAAVHPRLQSTLWGLRGCRAQATPGAGRVSLSNGQLPCCVVGCQPGARLGTHSPNPPNTPLGRQTNLWSMQVAAAAKLQCRSSGQRHRRAPVLRAVPLCFLSPARRVSSSV